MSNYYVQEQVERLEKENAELKKAVEAKKPIPREALKLLIDELTEPQVEALWVILGSILFPARESEF